MEIFFLSFSIAVLVQPLTLRNEAPKASSQFLKLPVVTGRGIFTDRKKRAKPRFGASATGMHEGWLA